MSTEEVINLNVGGKKFSCYQSTLMTYPDTLLARMFTSNIPKKKDANGDYFFDRNSEIFGLILEFYRTKRLIVPKGIPLDAVIEELNYFGIDLDEDDIEVENQRQDVDIISSFMEASAVLADLPSNGNHIGNVVIYENIEEDSEEGEEEEDEEEEDESDDGNNNNNAKKDKPMSKKKTEKVNLAMANWNEGATITTVPLDKPTNSEYVDRSERVDKHTKSDSEKEDSSSDENDKQAKKSKKKKLKAKLKFGSDDEDSDEKFKKLTPTEITVHYERFSTISKHLDKLRNASVFCAGGWFELLEEHAPHMKINTGVEVDSKPKRAAWYWAGDGKKHQDTWIPYTVDLNKKIEAAYQSNQKGKYDLDGERHVNFNSMRQVRNDSEKKWREVKREDLDDADGPLTKKPKTPKTAKMQKKAKKGHTTVWTDCGSVTKLEMDKVSELCVVAPYGDLKKMKTVVDPSVRLALECDAKKVRFYHSLRDVLSKIVEYLEECMWKSNSLYLQPYKLNVYGKGGFFKAHVDTPVDPGAMVGTLLLSFPVPHKGGALRVKHGSTEHVFDFSLLSNTSKVQWAAFFSDCEHEVLPVEEGNRVTFAYTISTKRPDYTDDGEDPFNSDGDFKEDEKIKNGTTNNDNNNNNNNSKATKNNDKEKKKKTNNDSDSSSSSGSDDSSSDHSWDSPELFKYYECKPGAIKSNAKMSLQIIYDTIKDVSAPSVGLFLAHKYTVRGLIPANLKGKDKELFEFLTQKKDLEVTLLPVVLQTHYERDWIDGEYLGPRETTRVVYALSKEDLNHLRGKGPKPTYNFKKVPFVIATTRGQKLASNHTDGSTGASGNYAPAEDDAMYMSSALVVTKK